MARDHDFYENKVEWNMDQARLMSIDNIMNAHREHMIKWRLEPAYWDLINLETEIFCVLTPEEVKEIEKKLKELNVSRSIYLKNKTQQTIGQYYDKMNILYISISRALVKHGLYLRQGGEMEIDD